MSITKPTPKQQWTRRLFICLALLASLFMFSIWFMQLDSLPRKFFGVLTIVTMLATIVCGVKIITSSTTDALKSLVKKPENTARRVYVAWIALLTPLLVVGLHIYSVLIADETSKLNFGAGGILLAAIIPTMAYVITPISLVAFSVTGFWARRLQKTYASDWFVRAWAVSLLLIFFIPLLLSLR